GAGARDLVEVRLVGMAVLRVAGPRRPRRLAARQGRLDGGPIGLRRAAWHLVVVREPVPMRNDPRPARHPGPSRFTEPRRTGALPEEVRRAGRSGPGRPAQPALRGARTGPYPGPMDESSQADRELPGQDSNLEKQDQNLL